AFVLAELEARGLTLALPADKRTLLRRATFDLIGLPPTPEEVEAFEADAAPDAFARVIDRLLASPRYGERWGRHWLDVVRYADTCGNAADYPVPQAHKYRDWVIRAFNRDLPYDQFLRMQLAGDLMPGGTDADRYERIVATLAAGVKQFEAAESEARKAPASPEKQARVNAAVKAVADARKKRTELQAKAPSINNAYAVLDAKPANVRMHLRGDPRRPGD